MFGYLDGILTMDLNGLTEAAISRRERRDGLQWLRQKLPWSEMATVAHALGSEAILSDLIWSDLVNGLVEEIILKRQEWGPLVTLQRLMSVFCLMRSQIEDCEADLPTELTLVLQRQVTLALSAILVQSDSPARDLLSVLTNERVDAALVGEEFYHSLETEVAVPLLAGLVSVSTGCTDPRNVESIVTDLALSLSIETLISSKSLVGFWRNVLPRDVALYFLAHGYLDAPFTDLVVRALLSTDPCFDKAKFLDHCLYWTAHYKRPDICQDIRFRLFEETLGATFAHEWLCNRAPDADGNSLHNQIIQCVEAFPLLEKVMLFYIDWGDLKRAVDLASDLPEVPQALEICQLERASKTLEPVSSAAALKLLRMAHVQLKPYANRGLADEPPLRFNSAWYKHWPRRFG